MSSISLVSIALLLPFTLTPTLHVQAHAAATKHTSPAEAKAATHDPSLFDFSLPKADGSSLPLSQLRGKTILLVNLARRSEYNSQIAALGTLQQTFASRGLVVLGVPSNDFGSEEPGSDAEVQQFYGAQKLPFQVMARSAIRGVQELPLYTFLTSGKGAQPGGDVHWNFTKFLINGKGEVIKRFSPDIAPDSPELLATVQQVVDGTYTPPKKDTESESEGDSPE